MALRIRAPLGISVFDAAVERLVALMAAGHRLVVAFSGGKDSTVTLHMTILAAQLTDRLPVDVMVQDEEIAFPGTYEFIEQISQMPQVRMNWLNCHQPIINIFDRAMPYFWVFDPLVPRDIWVREPPSFAVEESEINIEKLITPERFPAPGGKTMAVLGLRVQESRQRLYGLFSSGSHVTKPNRLGVSSVRPIYDWSDGDVWRAIMENHWPYNHAYDVFHRLGVHRSKLRIGPPTMTMMGADLLRYAAQAWPQWMARVSRRCPGVRAGAMFGRRAVLPQRRAGETWQECFTRLCLGDDTPGWIKERAARVMHDILHAHPHHSSQPLPEVEPCYHCSGNIGSWKNLTVTLYRGDPFSQRCYSLPYVEPDVFRVGAGKWGGRPSW